MPKLYIGCIFKSKGRLFRVEKSGAADGEYCWWINEVVESKHDKTVVYTPIDGLFHKSIKYMDGVLKNGGIKII